MPSYQPDGSEFTVNTVTADTQVLGRIAHLAGGGHVIVWSSPGDGWAQMYDAAGDPVGSQFLVQGSAAGGQGTTKITALAGGGFLITWTGESSTGLTGVVTGQIFNAAGGRVGSEFALTPPPAAHQFIQHYEISATDDGGFLVTWNNRFVGISWREFDAAGAQTGGEHAITTSAAGNPNLQPNVPNVVELEGGGYALSYCEMRYNALAEGFWDGYLVVKTYDSSWALLATDQTLITYGVNQQESEMDMAALAGGGSVVVADSGIMTDVVIARIYDAAGNQTGETQIVGSTNFSVAALPGGGFAVVSLDGEFYLEIFDAAGNLVQAATAVNTLTANIQARPDISVDANGDILIVWESQLGSGTLSYEIEARRFTVGAPTPVDGTGGPDSMNGTAGSDVLNGLGGMDFLHGLAGGDTLNGGDDRDHLYSGPIGDGADTLAGGNGDDFLFVDRFDIVVEGAGGGYDNVLAYEDYVLTAGALVEVLSTDNHDGTAAINLAGNALGQVIIGNAGDNVLDGGGGADRLAGFGGFDTYIVDSQDDFIDSNPALGQGGAVRAKVDYALAAGVSIGDMRPFDPEGTDNIDLYGNEISQHLYGNAGSNLLDGGAGSGDTLHGSTGNDFYIVKSGDLVVEESRFPAGGYDNVCARGDYTLAADLGIEVLSTTDHGGSAAINLTGNELGQVVIGNAGNNILDGKSGTDRLAGFGGADSYAFTTALGADNIDVIAGFDADDIILLDNAVFTALAGGALPAGAFALGTAAADADDRIIYDSATGRLFYDADGNGAGGQLHFATLEGAPALDVSDFTVI